MNWKFENGDNLQSTPNQVQYQILEKRGVKLWPEYLRMIQD